MDRRRFLGVTATLALSGCRSSARATDTARSNSELPMPKVRPTRGPLRVHAKNSRYFADTRGRAVYLTGAHTWPNCVDQGLTDPPPVLICPRSSPRLSGATKSPITTWRTWPRRRA